MWVLGISDRGVARGGGGGGAPPPTGKNYIIHWKKQGKFKGKGEKSGRKGENSEDKQKNLEKTKKKILKF